MPSYNDIPPNNPLSADDERLLDLLDRDRARLDRVLRWRRRPRSRSGRLRRAGGRA